MSSAVPRKRVTSLSVGNDVVDQSTRTILALDPDGRADLLARLARVAPGVEAVLVPTGQAMHIQLAAHRDLDLENLLHPVLLSTGLSEAACRTVRARAMRRDDLGSVAHLFRLASGLESRMVGEPEVLVSVAEAFALATEVGTIGPILERTMSEAVMLGERVRTHTAVGLHGTGLGAAVAATIAAWERDNGRAAVLMMGSGVVAASSLGELARQSRARVTIVSPDPLHAVEVARAHDAELASWDRRSELFVHNDVIVSAVDGDVIVASAGDLTPLAFSQKVFIDTASPGTLPSVHGVRHVDRRNLEDLVAHLSRPTQASIDDVHSLIEAALTSWRRWSGELDLDQRISAMIAAADRRNRTAMVDVLAAAADQIGSQQSQDLQRLLDREVSRQREQLGSTN